MIHGSESNNRGLNSNPKQSGIVFFDGICGLCNGFIDFLLVKDKNDVFVYAPLQGETAQKKLSKKDLENIHTIIYLEGDKTYYQSDAVFKILDGLGGLWKLFIVLKIVPKFIRDHIYNFIAKHRYKWFGKKDTCRLPTPEERNKILL